MKGSPKSQLISVLILVAIFLGLIHMANLSGNKIYKQRAKMAEKGGITWK